MRDTKNLQVRNFYVTHAMRISTLNTFSNKYTSYAFVGKCIDFRDQHGVIPNLQILNKQKLFKSIKTQRIYHKVHLLENECKLQVL
jgi:hypothetical protein